MKHLFINGVFNIVLGVLCGLAASLRGGELAMYRGAILGACVVAACCAVDMLGLKRFQLLLSSVVGGLFGLLAGGAILWFKLNPSGHYDLVQLGSSTLLACAAYGAMANLAFRWAYQKGCGFLAITGMVYLALVVVHVLRMWELFCFIHPVQIVVGAVFNCIPFALAVAWPMCRQLCVKKAAMSLRGFVVGTAAVLLLYMGGETFLQDLVIEYRPACFCAAHHHPEILSGMAGKIYYSPEGCYVFGRGKIERTHTDEWRSCFDVGGESMAVQSSSGVSLYSLDKHALLSTYDFGCVDIFALSPDGGKLAVAEVDGKHISVVDIRQAGHVVRLLAPDTWSVNDGLCWTKDSKSLVLVAAMDWLVEVAVPSGATRRLAEGCKPRLVADTGEIVFLQDRELCFLDLSSLAVRRLGVPNVIMDEFLRFGAIVYDVSPSGKFLVFIRRGGYHGLYKAFVMVADASPGGRMHVLTMVPRSSDSSLKWTK